MSACRSVSGLKAARKSRRSSITSTPAALASSISAIMPATLSAVTLVQISDGSDGCHGDCGASALAWAALVARRACMAPRAAWTGAVGAGAPCRSAAARNASGRGADRRLRRPAGAVDDRDAIAICRGAGGSAGG